MVWQGRKGVSALGYPVSSAQAMLFFAAAIPRFLQETSRPVAAAAWRPEKFAKEPTTRPDPPGSHHRQRMPNASKEECHEKVGPVPACAGLAFLLVAPAVASATTLTLAQLAAEVATLQTQMAQQQTLTTIQAAQLATPAVRSGRPSTRSSPERHRLPAWAASVTSTSTRPPGRSRRSQDLQRLGSATSLIGPKGATGRTCPVGPVGPTGATFSRVPPAPRVLLPTGAKGDNRRPAHPPAPLV